MATTVTATRECVSSSLIPNLICWVSGGGSSVANGGRTTPFSFANADTYDPLGLHDPGGANPERVSIPRTGNYLVVVEASWSPMASGSNIAFSILADNTTPFAGANSQTGYDQVSTYMFVTAHVPLAAGQYIQIGGGGFAGFLYQNSGGAEDFLASMLLYELR